MTDKMVNYQIVDKNGKVVEDVNFDDYDKLADHMMDVAEKYYAGVYSGGDSVNISAFDESGELIYKDTASFEAAEGDVNLDEEISEYIEPPTNKRRGGQGFGS